MNKVFNKGFNDTVGQSKTQIYKIWVNMLQRCYDEKYKTRQPTYIGCTVSEDWLIFSNFKDWVDSQDWKDKQLDKDLLVAGNKIYSSDTCVFISKQLNCFLREKEATRGRYPIGASYSKANDKFVATCSVYGRVTNLGYFDTPEDAHNAWKNKKREIAKEYALLQTDPRIVRALLSRY